MSDKNFAIMHLEKRKSGTLTGLQLEANREEKDRGIRDFPRSAIDWNRTGENEFLTYSKSWEKDAAKKCAEFGVKPRKNSTILITGLYTASPEWLKGKSRMEQEIFLESCLRFHEKNFGQVINAVIHFDESTPHLQVASVPVFRDANGKGHLSARDLIGGRAELHAKQEQFYREIGEPWGLDHPLPPGKEKRKHLQVQDFKISEKEKAIAEKEKIFSGMEKKISAGQKLLEEQEEKLERAREAGEDAAWEAKEKARAIRKIPIPEAPEIFPRFPEPLKEKKDAVIFKKSDVDKLREQVAEAQRFARGSEAIQREFYDAREGLARELARMPSATREKNLSRQLKIAEAARDLACDDLKKERDRAQNLSREVADLSREVAKMDEALSDLGYWDEPEEEEERETDFGRNPRKYEEWGPSL